METFELHNMKGEDHEQEQRYNSSREDVHVVDRKKLESKNNCEDFEGDAQKLQVFHVDDEEEEETECYTRDGSVDFRGNPAAKAKTGRWLASALILVNQGLATLAFFGVGVNLVLFLTRVLDQSNADSANSVSKWTGTVYIFSLVGAFLSDSYWGRFKTCAVFQLIFVIGMVLLSLSSYLFLLKPSGCGDGHTPCAPHSGMEIALFYVSIYLVALGNGGYQPNIATLGADQFDGEDSNEAHSKVAFFSYFYLALNLGQLFSNTFLSYFEDEGLWALGFWASTGSAFVALVLFLAGATRYRHFKPCGNPLSRVCQVIVAAVLKWRAEVPPGGGELYEVNGKEIASPNGVKKTPHTSGFKFLDRAALIVPNKEFATTQDQKVLVRNPWRLCTITQVEELKCILRLLPIWLCTILYSVVFTQMASLFVVQGAAMNTSVFGFRVPPASMSAFDILSVGLCIFLYRSILRPRGLNELQRMGIGLILAAAAMVSAAAVEHFRLKAHIKGDGSSLSIMWQVIQYALIGASEVFMYVGQLEFFNSQAPEGLKSFGSALCMTSISFGNYVSDMIVTVVMKITADNGRPGWIPSNLNKGHMDRFFYLLAILTVLDFVVYVGCAKWYQSIKVQDNNYGDDDEISNKV